MSENTKKIHLTEEEEKAVSGGNLVYKGNRTTGVIQVWSPLDPNTKYITDNVQQARDYENFQCMGLSDAEKIARMLENGMIRPS